MHEPAGPSPTQAHPRGETATAGDLVAAMAPAHRLSAEAILQAAGLEIVGCCERLSDQPELLQASPLLQDFTPAEADILGRAMLRVRARPGQLLMAEDDPSDWMLLLLSGTVDVGKRKVGPDADRGGPGENTRLAVLKAGAVVGEMSMLDGEPRYASCRALSDVHVAVLTREALARLITTHPGVGAKLLVKITQLLAQRLRNTSNQLLRMLRQR